MTIVSKPILFNPPPPAPPTLDPVTSVETPTDGNIAISGASSNWLKNAVQNGASYQSMVSMFLAMCADWSEKRLVSAMDKAAKDMETYNEYESYKSKLDIIASELATKDKDAKATLPPEITSWLTSQGISFPGNTLNMGQLKTLVVDVQKAGAAFGDRNTANNLEVQQAMTALNATREEQKGFVKKMVDLRESISRATYG
ncbi:hypothetical protein [Cupriavidus pampae]|uniref:Uncharacterized protein n=1 Tax=Cupriavidus pampae TaxID=659251 RepID=A0ABN7ZP86_9BURK|nr:hypothetical protein [Cupriavidus pampae]CAG9185939.1 hypothetical protein LMG32289_06171 [Cupriavidus pampae]